MNRFSDTASASLEWISNETLDSIVEKRFRNALSKIKKPATNLRTDPTLVVALSTLLDIPISEVDETIEHVSIVKTLQNAIGLLHQDILGSVDGWKNMGTTGGNYDIYSENAVDLAGGKHVVAEVKMRYNTIKSSDESKVFDMLHTSAKGMHQPTVAYLIQIVPETTTPYNRPWKVSGRSPNEKVYCIDGTSAYHLVTGDPNALSDLIKVLPSAFRRVLDKKFTSKEQAAAGLEHTELPTSAIEKALALSIPNHSVFTEE